MGSPGSSLFIGQILATGWLLPFYRVSFFFSFFLFLFLFALFSFVDHLAASTASRPFLSSLPFSFVSTPLLLDISHSFGTARSFFLFLRATSRTHSLFFVPLYIGRVHLAREIITVLPG